MADNLTKNESQRRERAIARQDYELRYWSDKWHVSQEDVKRAIEKVGPMVKDVARELGRA